MEKSFLEKIKDAKLDHEIATINFFNDGTISTDDYEISRKALDRNKWTEYYEDGYILDVLKNAASDYAQQCDFDSIEMQMRMGLVYNISDVDENKNIKAGASPLKNIVRYYTLDIDSFLDGDKTNDRDYRVYGIGRQSYIDYNTFIKYVRKSGLSFNGPESFEEFRRMILSKEPFDISIGANLVEEKPKNLIKKLF